MQKYIRGTEGLKLTKVFPMKISQLNNIDIFFS